MDQPEKGEMMGNRYDHNTEIPIPPASTTAASVFNSPSFPSEVSVCPIFPLENLIYLGYD